MKNILFEGNINFDNEEKDRYDYELFSLKITDSLYKKDIGKFLETLSSHFIQLKNYISDLQTKTLWLIDNVLKDNK